MFPLRHALPEWLILRLYCLKHQTWKFRNTFDRSVALLHLHSLLFRLFRIIPCNSWRNARELSSLIHVAICLFFRIRDSGQDNWQPCRTLPYHRYSDSVVGSVGVSSRGWWRCSMQDKASAVCRKPFFVSLDVDLIELVRQLITRSRASALSAIIYVKQSSPLMCRRCPRYH